MLMKKQMRERKTENRIGVHMIFRRGIPQERKAEISLSEESRLKTSKEETRAARGMVYVIVPGRFRASDVISVHISIPRAIYLTDWNKIPMVMTKVKSNMARRKVIRKLLKM